MCGLLLNKKFPFFSSLIDLTEKSISQPQDGEMIANQRASVNDLLGMWTTIAKQIADIDRSFERLRRWREVSHWAFSSPPATPAGHVSSSSKDITSSSGPDSVVPVSTVAKMKSRTNPKVCVHLSDANYYVLIASPILCSC